MKSNVRNRNDFSENSGWANPAFSPKNKDKFLANLSKRQKNDANSSKRNSTNENAAQNFSKAGDDFIVPEIVRNDDKNESLSPRGGQYNLRPIPNPSYSDDSRYWNK